MLDWGCTLIRFNWPEPLPESLTEQLFHISTHIVLNHVLPLMFTWLLCNFLYRSKVLLLCNGYGMRWLSFVRKVIFFISRDTASMQKQGIWAKTVLMHSHLAKSRAVRSESTVFCLCKLPTVLKLPELICEFNLPQSPTWQTGYCSSAGSASRTNCGHSALLW